MSNVQEEIGFSTGKTLSLWTGAEQCTPVPSSRLSLRPIRPLPVILSGAPRDLVLLFADGRGVEGSRYCIVSRCSLKAFSREFPDAAWALNTFSGSFDSAPITFSTLELVAALRSG